MDDNHVLKIILIVTCLLGSLILLSTINPNEDTVLSQFKPDDSSKLFDNRFEENESERYVKNAFNNSKPWKKEDSLNLKWNRYIYEVNRYPNEDLNDIYLENSWILYSETYEEAEENNWFNFEKAIEDEYNNTYSRDHYVNLNHYRDNETLVPEKPEFLIFRENSSESKVLVGVMYMQNNVSSEGRQVGGPLTKWHYHTFMDKTCYYTGYAIKNQTSNCPDRYYSRKSSEMLHVWFVNHLEGTFATNMYVSNETVDNGVEKMNKTEFVKDQIEHY